MKRFTALRMAIAAAREQGVDRSGEGYYRIFVGAYILALVDVGVIKE